MFVCVRFCVLMCICFGVWLCPCVLFGVCLCVRFVDVFECVVCLFHVSCVVFVCICMSLCVHFCV